MTNPEVTLFGDHSGSPQEGARQAGRAGTTTTEALEAEASAAGWSARWAELYLVQALTLRDGKRVIGYTDSGSAFAAGHTQGPPTRRGAS